MDIDSPGRKRIGIILGTDIDVSAIPPLKYLILQANCQQTYFEYAFFPRSNDPLFTQLSVKSVLSRQIIKGLLPDFLVRYEEFLTLQQTTYKLQETEPLPDYYIYVGLTRFDDEYYLSGVKRLGIVALGNWKRMMAPPSLLEFIFKAVLIESVYVMGRFPGLSHLGTKGCMFDFSVELSDARYGTLQSFVCDNCRAALSKANYPRLAEQLVKIADKTWLGSLAVPSSPAGIISNLHYDLFSTKGLTPTFWERTSAIIQSDGVRELIKLVAAILLAGAIFYLGWKH